ncbi:ABC-type multidrug transport system, ATPase and permease component [Desulfosporosinus youngiae DSM 17734]|uniref:ABC-type multidrug transport system, ATPase and permease component n=2 Tax=Desulfosporosinus TaxID=79206 RepID=H5XUF0_9FIRM|nr:ABC-type multidrug transport system, ATPase and permease component [Desulfosporosinus youngiae DSM 17734]
MIILLNSFIPLATVATAISTKHIIDFSVQKDIRQAGIYIVVFALLILMQVLLSSLVNIKSTYLREKLNNDIQKEFLSLLYKIKWNSLNKYHSGDVLTRLTSDVSIIVNGIVTLLPSLISLSVQLIAAFLTLLYYDKTMAIFAFILGPISVCLGWLVGRRLKKMQHAIQSSESRYRSYIHESIQNSLIIKIFEISKWNLQRIKELQKTKLDLTMKRAKYGIATSLVIGLGYRLGFFMAFVLGAINLSRGISSFGTFTAFLQLVGQVQGPFEGLARSLPQVVSTIASAERLMEFEELQLEKSNDSVLSTINEPMGLFIDHTSFAYDNRNMILSDISLTIHPGEIVALIGPSGEGKTTLVRMLLGLLPPLNGAIYLLHKNYGKVLVSDNTKKHFSYVPQGNTLFSSSIAENLRIGNPSASDNELIVAAKTACAWQFIKNFPDGMNTLIGEHGVGLSEGQSQRLSIARALLRQSSILLLDEATSSLDIETECTIFENIRRLTPPRTCIAITHRQSVFDKCDRIIRLSEGTLYEEKNTTSYKN